MAARRDGHGDIAERLRRAKLRVTGPRLAMLAELDRNRAHPDAWNLHRLLRARHRSLSVSTVYLNLEAFIRAGLVRRLPGRDGRMRVDGTVLDHDHAVCRDCGDVFDVPPLHKPARWRPPVLPDGLKVLHARVEYEVLCARCQAGRPTRGPRVPETRSGV
jgi:Fe2+ or Zn2+ uptake regulation protein